jgi:polyisoprenoid-binding protein YceI
MTVIETTTTRTIDGAEVPAAGTYAIDASHSQAGFVVRHLMVSKVRGAFTGVSGTVTVADDVTASTVEVEIDPASIDTRDAGRDEHLRSADFLGVEEFPTIAYRSTGLRRDGGDWRLDGELTIKGVSRSVSLDVEFLGAAGDPWGGTRLGFSASGELDRENWGLNWNQALETGGVLVGKDIKIEIEVEAVLQTETPEA